MRGSNIPDVSGRPTSESTPRRYVGGHRQVLGAQAVVASPIFSATSIGIRIFMASARLNPVGRARTDVLFGAVCTERLEFVVAPITEAEPVQPAEGRVPRLGVAHAVRPPRYLNGRR
jgi:hypothetical protein